MKILVLTDSLSLPRLTRSETVLYEETYLFKLKKAFPGHEIISTAIGGGTIEDMVRQAWYYKAFFPDMIFLQCGIVDCAPRAFTRYEANWIDRLKLGRFLKGFHPPLRKIRNIRYTSPRKFDRYLRKFKSSFEADTAIYAIGILPGSPAYEKKVPGIRKSIKRYNEMLQKHFTFIDNSDFSENEILEDLHHLNSAGHTKLFEKIAAIIKG